jgi:hypothetical protein
MNRICQKDPIRFDAQRVGCPTASADARALCAPLIQVADGPNREDCWTRRELVDIIGTPTNLMR